jgi:hypothetical protein
LGGVAAPRLGRERSFCRAVASTVRLGGVRFHLLEVFESISIVTQGGPTYGSGVSRDAGLPKSSSKKGTSDRRPSRPASGVFSDYARQLRISGFSSATAPLTADRLKKTPSLALIGIASFVSLLPIALAIMNAKTTVEISTNPIAPPSRFHVENFTSARGKARPSARASFIAPKWWA